MSAEESEFRRGFSGRPLLRSRFLGARVFPGARRFGSFWRGRRGPSFGGYRRWGGRFVPRLASWVRRPFGYGARPWYRGRWGGARLAPWVRSPAYARFAPWARGRTFGRYPWAAGGRPWIYRQPIPHWFWRFLPQLASGFAPPPVVAAPPPPEPVGMGAPPEPVAVAAPPEGGEPPPEPAAAAPPEGGEPPPADAGAAGAAPPDAAAGGAPPEGAPGGAPPEGGGEAPPAGELPQELEFSAGPPVRIKWDARVRGLRDQAPPGGGVYVVYRDGKPETAHMTSDFRADVAKRFEAEMQAEMNEAEGETEGEEETLGQGEFFRRRRRGRTRGRSRSRRMRMRLRYGRMSAMRRYSRMRRIQMLRSLRERLSQQQGASGFGGDEPEPPEESQDDDDQQQEPQD